MRKYIVTLLCAGALIAGANSASAQGGGRRQNAGPPAAEGPSQGSPLASIFSCQNPDNHQGEGALIGGLIGGIVGNQVAGDDKRDRTIGTVLGAAVGAAAGSYVGCRMASGDVTRAQAATQTALSQGRSQDWDNQRSGASGRTEIVNSYDPADRYAGPQPISLDSLRWSDEVERPGDFLPAPGMWRASGVVVVRSGPSDNARPLDKLVDGDGIDGVLRIAGADWLLVARDGAVLGYVPASRMLAPDRGPPASRRGSGQTCRVFDQTFTARDGQPETQRYTACQNARGEWLVQS